MGKDERLEITIKYKDFKETISGSVENVTNEYFKILSKVIPAFSSISGLFLEPNILEMASRLKGSVLIFRDRVFVTQKDIPTEDAVLLALLAKYFGFGLNMLTNDNMSLQEMLDSTGKNRKSVNKTVENLKSANAIEQLDGKYRIIDWKAYDYVLRKLSNKKDKTLSDFVENGYSPQNLSLHAFTIGYEGQEIGPFLNLLKKEGITTLIDVRKDAYSKQDVSYSEGNLSRIAANAKIRYIHLPELGVDYEFRQELKSTHNYDGYFKRYSDYLEKNPDLVSLVADLAKGNSVCLLCYERDFRRCHRSVLASKLEPMGIIFHHLP
jgi:hypothetical protein